MNSDHCPSFVSDTLQTGLCYSPRHQCIYIASFLILTTPLAVVLNTVFLYAVVRNKNLQRNTSALFVALSGTDLFTRVAVFPLYTLETLHNAVNIIN